MNYELTWIMALQDGAACSLISVFSAEWEKHTKFPVCPFIEKHVDTRTNKQERESVQIQIRKIRFGIN